MKKIIIILLLTMLSNVQAGSGLQIYLPREITVSSDKLLLGDISVIQGDDALAAKAQAIPLGRFSSAGQKITIDKKVLTAALASNGIRAWQVTFTGANEVTISQKHLAISGQDFADKALAYLTENPPHISVCKYTLTQTPQDLILTDVNDNIKLTASITSNVNSQVKVLVSVFCGEKELGSREVAFSMKYTCKKAVAAADIPAGTILNAENVKVENFTANQPQPANWTPPYGLAAKKLLPGNSEITMNMLEILKPPVLLQRNQNVLIKIDRLGLVVTAIGKTMQEGRTGEYIKVQNLSSQRIIIGKVQEDGSVEPVL
ncbi:MAG: flagellar basal body P-ring formation chaperone FlgA [Planctomycetaceae bacterium]|nr:flagellar basal body P-ring formation chaperone FlgA [Planctomycetaceae bacterium]